jgi:hypothetical protein
MNSAYRISSGKKTEENSDISRNFLGGSGQEFELKTITSADLLLIGNARNTGNEWPDSTCQHSRSRRRIAAKESIFKGPENGDRQNQIFQAYRLCAGKFGDLEKTIRGDLILPFSQI